MKAISSHYSDPTAAGKSTTIGIISSLVTKTAGSVSVLGLDSDTHITEIKSRLGIVPQEINFSLFETCLNILLNQAGYYGNRPEIGLRQRGEIPQATGFVGTA